MSQPETSMGAQTVNITMDDGITIKSTVFNSENLVIENDFPIGEIKNIEVVEE